MTARSEPSGAAWKLVLSSGDDEAALGIAAALAELIEPPADAVSRFAEPHGWRVEAYFSEAPDSERIAETLADVLGGARPSLTLEPVPAENWVAISQAALPPVEAARFTVHGSHDAYRIPRGPNALLIDAGEAFGTAHHATTLGCLVAIDRLSRRWQPRSVLDLGCGSGVLALAARRVWPRASIMATDIDPIAIEVARANARANGITGVAFEVVDGVPRSGGNKAVARDLVIANILAGPLIAMAHAIAPVVAPGGRLVLSGLLVPQAQAVLGAYLTRGLVLERRDDRNGWSTLTLAKR